MTSDGSPPFLLAWNTVADLCTNDCLDLTQTGVYTTTLTKFEVVKTFHYLLLQFLFIMSLPRPHQFTILHKLVLSLTNLTPGLPSIKDSAISVAPCFVLFETGRGSHLFARLVFYHSNSLLGRNRTHGLAFSLVFFGRNRARKVC